MKKIKPKKLPPYRDLADLPENKRIDAICARLRTGEIVGVVIDDEQPKVDRYLKKIRNRMSGQIEVEESPGPVPESRVLKIRMVVS
jgi:ribosome assembly protein YihI (activator of Der GTPase)